MRLIGRRGALFLSTVVLVVLSLSTGWIVSWSLERLETPLTLPGGFRLAEPAPRQGAQLALFWEAMELLDRHYYGRDEIPQGNDLTYAAIDGVILGTRDPHTAFINPDNAEIVASRLEGEFEGIGAQVEMSEQGLVIVAPLPDTPADRAGLRAGDLVLEVDGLTTRGMDLLEAVAIVRGPKGTPVLLTVRREGVEETLTFEITRDTVVVASVTSRMIEEEGRPPIGYLKLNIFSAQAPDELRDALLELQGAGATGVLLDLRNNGGGFLDASIEIASEFIGEGLIVSEKGSNGRDRTHPARSGGVALEIPLVVLVNEGSASASEIVAGAIRDTGRGTIVGTTTFGKGSVQITHDLSDGSDLRVTVARWFTPNGTAIHEIGIVPDLVVEQDEDALEAGQDVQLEAALEQFR